MFRKGLTIVCAWCGEIMRKGSRAVSHGMCAACAAKFEDEKLVMREPVSGSKRPTKTA